MPTPPGDVTSVNLAEDGTQSKLQLQLEKTPSILLPFLEPLARYL